MTVDMSAPHHATNKEILLLQMDEDGHTNRRITISCNARDDLFTKITHYCGFQEWATVSAVVGRARIHVYRAGETEESAKGNLGVVLNTFLGGDAATCSIIVVTKEDYVRVNVGRQRPDHRPGFSPPQGPGAGRAEIVHMRSLLGRLEALK